MSRSVHEESGKIIKRKAVNLRGTFMRIKIKAAVCACMLVAMSLFSETSSESFDSVCNKLAKHANTVGNFTQVKRINAAKRSLKSSGTFIFSLDGIMWKTLKPFPSIMAIGITSIIQTAPDGKKTVIDVSKNQIFKSIAVTLSSVFSGNAEALYTNFSVAYDIQQNRWKADLTPKDSTVAAVMKTLIISGTVNTETATLDTIVMAESSGDIITYTFTDQTYPQELTDAEKANFSAE